MIVLNKLNHDRDSLYLNPDLIQVVEARPDTHIQLTTGAHIVVFETPEQVAEAIQAYRVGILAEALRVVRTSSGSGELI